MRLTCALTGHRALPQNFNVNALYDALEERIRAGCDRFLCGMARGFDLTALKCLADLREKYKITLVACIPYRGQVRSMQQEERALYCSLLDFCNEKIVLHEAYVNGCFLERNRYMVDRADVLLAYCTQEEGGTAYTIAYAKKRGVDVVLFEN